jgi:hypothetical protein
MAAPPARRGSEPREASAATTAESASASVTHHPRQAGIVGCEVQHVLAGKQLRLRTHDRILALVQLVGAKRMRQIVLVLTGKPRVTRIDRRIAVLAVASFSPAAASADMAGAAASRSAAAVSSGRTVGALYLSGFISSPRTCRSTQPDRRCPDRSGCRQWLSWSDGCGRRCGRH